MANFCPNCGSKVESVWNACPNCGTALQKIPSNQIAPHYYNQPTPQTRQDSYQIPAQQPYQQVPQSPYQPRTDNSNGIASLIFGLIGFACCGLLGIPAIYFGNKGMKEDYNKTLSQIGIILGVLNLACCLFLPILFFMYLY